MLPDNLLPLTAIRESGNGPIVTIPREAERTAVLTLGITRITEREEINISVWGSPDQANWGTAPLASFNNKFYCGEYELELDLSHRSDIRYLRVHWELNAKGHNRPRTVATLSVRAQELPRLAAAGA
jgi:hypothetical protein